MRTYETTVSFHDKDLFKHLAQQHGCRPFWNQVRKLWYLEVQDDIEMRLFARFNPKLVGDQKYQKAMQDRNYTNAINRADDKIFKSMPF